MNSSNILVSAKTAQQCRSGPFEDSDFAGDLEDSKSTSGGIFMHFRQSNIFPICWMCKKQTSVSHSSTEAEVFSLDAALRMDGISALDHWDLVVEVRHDAEVQRASAGRPAAHHTVKQTHQREIF